MSRHCPRCGDQVVQFPELSTVCIDCQTKLMKKLLRDLAPRDKPSLASRFSPFDDLLVGDWIQVKDVRDSLYMGYLQEFRKNESGLYVLAMINTARTETFEILTCEIVRVLVLGHEFNPEAQL